MGRIVLSNKFRNAAKLSNIPLYRLAIQCGIPPGTVYRKTHGIDPTNPSDERYVRLGKLLGLTAAECFEEQEVGGEMGGAD